MGSIQFLAPLTLQNAAVKNKTNTQQDNLFNNMVQRELAAKILRYTLILDPSVTNNHAVKIAYPGKADFPLNFTYAIVLNLFHRATH